MPRAPTKITNELKPIIDDLSQTVVLMNTGWIEIDEPLFDGQIKQIRTLTTEMRRIAMRSIPESEKKKLRRAAKTVTPQ